jgi:hypothetical protein
MLPKIKVEGLGWDLSGELLDFEQAKYFPFDSRDLLIAAEGKIVRSYTDLVKLTEADGIEGKATINVRFLPIIVGG